MKYELTGKLIEKYEMKQMSDSFRKREFVMEVTEKRSDNITMTEYIKMTLTNARCKLIDFIPLNTELKIIFCPKGRRFEKEGVMSYFTNLEAINIERI